MPPAGVDFNVLRIAFAVRIHAGIAAHVVRAIAPRAVKYGLEVVQVGRKAYLVAVYGLGERFEGWLLRRLRGLAARYAGEVEVARELVPAGLRLVDVKIPEWCGSEVRRVVLQALSEAGLEEVPGLFNVELRWALRRLERAWRLAYRAAVKSACFRIGWVASRVASIEPVVLKLEDLSNIHRKVVANPRTRRWCYGVMRRTLMAALSPRVGVALVDPADTSSYTPCCGARARRVTYEVLKCPSCGRTWHRDAIAAINIAEAPVERWLRRPAR